MSMSQPRKGAHSVFSIHLHFVFVTKYRRKVLTSEIIDRLHDIFANVCVKNQCHLIEFSGESDHVHLLIDFHPNNNISDFTASLKSASSRVIRKEFAEYLSTTYRKNTLWSSSYYVASSGGAPIEKLKLYIKSQELPES
ncbi:IS200/IS605 family transposase [Floridanema evergladense]|uniref:IS200/IS605 family transposase n=1 Tax=Floridaenema evergladense BLCC-F167 TaxID=3153639 RepID=A0ABV4WD44_9CYAN